MEYAGLDLHKSFCQTKICTKEGSKYLRWILVEAVSVHVRWCPNSKITKHYNKIKKKKGANIAATAAARKLLQVIYHMLKNKEIFRIEG